MCPGPVRERTDAAGLFEEAVPGDAAGLDNGRQPDQAPLPRRDAVAVLGRERRDGAPAVDSFSHGEPQIAMRKFLQMHGKVARQAC